MINDLKPSQLPDDPDNYGPDAGAWIIASSDTNYSPCDPVFDTEPQCQQAISRIVMIVRAQFPTITTLLPRYRDHLDFHDVSIVRIRDALIEAYKVGFDAGRREQ